MSNFFIRRPIVAMVIAILTVIVGVVMAVTLPVAQFPNIAPPEIRMQATYVGADAKALEQAVATPIEQQINGVDNLDYAPGTRLLYAAAGKAARLTVARLEDDGQLTVTATAETAPGARNAVSDANGNAYLADGQAARLLLVSAAKR